MKLSKFFYVLLVLTGEALSLNCLALDQISNGTGLLRLQPSMQVIDQAGLFSEANKSASQNTFDALKRDVKIDFRVIVIRSLQTRDLFTFTTAAFESLKIGDQTQNRGALIVVALDERRVRFQVSKSIEPIFTDAFIGYIERNQMAPYFDRNELNAGIQATIELAVKRAYDSLKMNSTQIQNEDLILRSKYRTGGGGATGQFGVGVAAESGAKAANLIEYGAQPTPELAWEKFYLMHARKLMIPQAEIFDPQAKEMAKRYTPASLDFIARLYANKKPLIRVEGQRAAVVFLDDPNFELAPWFFKKSTLGWQLDGSAYPSLIKYNHLNQWHFAQIDHQYMFAFRDYSINLNGYATSPTILANKTDTAGGVQTPKRRGWMGASFTNAQRLSRFLSEPQTRGVVLYGLVPTGAAAKAGLEEGDVVLTLNGIDIVGHSHFEKMIGTRLEGDVVSLQVIRGLIVGDFSLPRDPDHTTVRPVTKNLKPPTQLKITMTLLGSRDGK